MLIRVWVVALNRVYNMFLITTSYEPSWNNGAKKILFAGEWCKLFSNKKSYEGIFDYEIFPSHWLDQGDFYRDIKYYEIY